MTIRQNFFLHQWAVWPPLDSDQKSDATQQRELLSKVPKMLKRRLSPLAKTVFCAANQCLADHPQLPTVFSSTHGELARSFAMLELLEAGEEISPTAFSLSVYNAIAGLFSIAWQNRLQCTVVAPGEEGMAAAFMEALGLLDEGADEVLLLFYDEPLVSFYPAAPYRLSTNQRTALALRIGKQSLGLALQMYSSLLTGDDGEQPCQLPLFVQFLTGPQQQLTIRAPRHSWCWKKHD